MKHGTTKYNNFMMKEILIISSKAKTKISNMRIKIFGGIHYLQLSISICSQKKKTLIAFTPNVKILESNMVSRNLDYGSKNIKKKKKKKNKHIVLKKKKI